MFLIGLRWCPRKVVNVLVELSDRTALYIVCCFGSLHITNSCFKYANVHFLMSCYGSTMEGFTQTVQVQTTKVDMTSPISHLVRLSQLNSTLLYLFDLKSIVVNCTSTWLALNLYECIFSNLSNLNIGNEVRTWPIQSPRPSTPSLLIILS